MGSRVGLRWRRCVFLYLFSIGFLIPLSTSVCSHCSINVLVKVPVPHWCHTVVKAKTGKVNCVALLSIATFIPSLLVVCCCGSDCACVCRSTAHLLTLHLVCVRACVVLFFDCFNSNFPPCFCFVNPFVQVKDYERCSATPTPPSTSRGCRCWIAPIVIEHCRNWCTHCTIRSSICSNISNNSSNNNRRHQHQQHRRNIKCPNRNRCWFSPPIPTCCWRTSTSNR